MAASVRWKYPPMAGRAGLPPHCRARSCRWRPCDSGRPSDALVGGIGSLAPDKTPIRTVGSYWPYATTFFDYVRRAMPFQDSKSLAADELYAITAYILHLNGIIGENDVIDSQTLPKV